MELLKKRTEFPAPSSMDVVDASLRRSVEEAAARTEETARDAAAMLAMQEDRVPVLRVPQEVLSLDGARMAVAASMNLRG